MNEIKISVDINVNLSESTQNFLTSILSGAHTPALPASPELNNQEQEQEKPAEEEKPASKPRVRRAKAKEEPVKEEPPLVACNSAALAPKEEKPGTQLEMENLKKEEPVKEEPVKEEPVKEEPKAESKVDLETLRAKFKTAAASQENRTKLREKLQELGCSNLTNLDPSKYNDMNQFIDTL